MDGRLLDGALVADLRHGLHDVAVPGVVAALHRLQLLERADHAGATEAELLADATKALQEVLDHLRSMQDRLRGPAAPGIDLRDG